MTFAAVEAGEMFTALAAQLAGLPRVELSHPLVEGMHAFAGHPQYRHIERGSQGMGDPTSHFELNLSEHTGTHLDAPVHVVRGKPDITSFDTPLTRAAVLRPAEPQSNVGMEDLRRFEGESGRIRAGDSVIVDHGWAARWGDDSYMIGWPDIDVELAQELVDRGVVLVAVDTPSPDASGCDTSFPVHETILGSGAFIGENFTNLSRLGPWFLLDLIPLPISDGTGSPVRALALNPEHRSD